MQESKFRTTELSQPQFEMDGLRFITVKSENLKGRGDICIFVPKGTDLVDLPVVTLLHGVYGSSWVWSFLGGAHKVTQKLIDEGRIKPVILAMPSDGMWGDGSGYLAHENMDFERWIAEDVPQAVIENIPQASKSSKLFISGLSMGGFGAMRIGAKYGKNYSGISGHSSITSLEQMKLFVEGPLTAYYQKNKSDEDVFLSIMEHKETLPPLRFDCGKEDDLIEYNRALHKQLEENDIQHIYEEFKGCHEWIYWQTHLEETLIFFDQFHKS